MSDTLTLMSSALSEARDSRMLLAMTDEQKTERVQLLMTAAEVKAVDDWSFANRIRGRSEAIRRLIERGLAAESGQEPGADKASR